MALASRCSRESAARSSAPTARGRPRCSTSSRARCRVSSGRITLFGRDVTGTPPPIAAPPGPRPHLSDHQPVPRSDGAGECPPRRPGATRRAASPCCGRRRRFGDLQTRARATLDSVGLAGGRRCHACGTCPTASSASSRSRWPSAGRPRLLLLDEPTAGLSPAESRLMAGLLRRLDPAITVLMIEHDMDIALELSPRGHRAPLRPRHRRRLARRGEGRPAGAGDLPRCLRRGGTRRGGRAHLLRRQPRAPGHLAPRGRRARSLAILGRNGMGKTTLIRSIIGFTPPRRGARALQGPGHHAAGRPTGWWSAGMALVPQGRRVFPR